MRPNVYITRPVGAEAVEMLAAHCDVTCRQQDLPITPAELGEALGDMDGLMLAGARLPAEVVAGALRLCAVSSVGVGYDNVDLAACTARRIPVTNTVGVVEETTADLAFALLLAAARRLPECDRYVREGQWRHWGWTLLWGADVHGKTLGLYGFGNIAQAVARRARGFDMRILYCARRRAPEAIEQALGAERVDRDTLFAESDFVSLHVALTSETRHSVGEAELARMKPSAYLINTARGKVVDEEALAEALQQHAIAGAGLDVFEQEPHVHPTLLTLPNVVLAPHVGSGTAETRARMARVAAQNLLDLFDGKRPKTLLNPEIFDQSVNT
ncbi:MAG TPA: D-glycerate dehydrogenase [Terriglobia bacterium]|nr:D-glycerate dehydrogenase [Terriglobia bacterium]